MNFVVRIALLLVAIFAGGILPCHAKLGQTLEQCVALYGNPTADKGADAFGLGGRNYVFQNNGIYYNVIFLNGVSGAERLTKVDGSQFYPDQISNILSFFADGKPWLPSPHLDPYWTRADNSAQAFLRSKARLLIFETRACHEAYQAKHPEDAGP